VQITLILGAFSARAIVAIETRVSVMAALHVRWSKPAVPHCGVAVAMAASVSQKINGHSGVNAPWGM
jgi:hypothetical protein